MYKVERAIFPVDLDDVLDLYREYIGSTSVDLGFQGNDEEFKCLSENYSSDESKIFLARINETPVGCAAFRKVDNHTCEMKRVYVRPAARGSKLGAKLVDIILEEAIKSGYKKICLDVLPEFKAALNLYKSYGFVNHPPVTNNPVPGTQFLGLDLDLYNKKLQRTSR